MSTTQLRSSRVKWVNNVKNETHKRLREFDQEGKERAIFVKQNASAVKLFLNESEEDRLSTHKETMAVIKDRLQQLRQEEKEILKNAHEILKNAYDLIRKIAEENKELSTGVKRFLTHSESERQAVYKTMMEGLHQSIRELRERTKEIRRGAVELLKQFGGENGTLKTELKKFLKESEETRIRDFKKMMSEVKAVVGEIQAYEVEERRLAGAGIKVISSDVVKKKEITHETKPEKKAAMEGKLKVETERKKFMSVCKECGIRHWPFQKCPQGKSSFKKKKIT